MKFVYHLSLFESNQIDGEQPALKHYYYSNLKKSYQMYVEVLTVAEQPTVTYSHIAAKIKKEGQFFSNFSHKASITITKHEVL